MDELITALATVGFMVLAAFATRAGSRKQVGRNNVAPK